MKRRMIKFGLKAGLLATAGVIVYHIGKDNGIYSQPKYRPEPDGLYS